MFLASVLGAGARLLRIPHMIFTHPEGLCCPKPDAAADFVATMDILRRGLGGAAAHAAANHPGVAERERSDSGARVRLWGRCARFPAEACCH